MGFRVVKTPLDLTRSPSLLPRHRDCPGLAQENQAAAPPAGTGATSGADGLAWHVWCQEQKLLVRENTVMRYFFLFVLLDNLVISSLSYQVSRRAHVCPCLYPPVPCPPRNPRGPSPRAHTPCWALLSDKRPAGRSRGGRGPSKVGCRHALRHLFLLLFCFQPTLEQREKPGSTHKQIQSKETERQRFRGRSPERRHQGGRMPPRARPLNGWNQVSSHSLTLGQNVRLDGVHVDTGLGGCSLVSPSHCP